MLDILPGVVAADQTERALILPGGYIVKRCYRRTHIQPPARRRCAVRNMGRRLNCPSALDRGSHETRAETATVEVPGLWR